MESLAKICTSCGLAKPSTDFSKHVRSKDGLYQHCRPCKAARAAISYAKHAEKTKERVRSYTQENAEKVNQQRRQFRQANSKRLSAEKMAHLRENPDLHEKKLQYLKAYYQKNKAFMTASMAEYQKKNREAANARNRKYGKANRPKMSAAWQKYRASKLKATPKWATQEKIEALYKEAARLTRETGIVHHVDHIVPLRSKLVCGLHVEFNLQVLEGKENVRKSNKVWPEMP